MREFHSVGPHLILLSFVYLLMGLDSVFQSLKGGLRFLAFMSTTDILSAVGI